MNSSKRNTIIGAVAALALVGVALTVWYDRTHPDSTAPAGLEPQVPLAFDILFYTATVAFVIALIAGIIWVRGALPSRHRNAVLHNDHNDVDQRET
jgi:hypothetical protein